ncbi:unnamed protein product [Cuscuta europaea]|uniref:Non-specific lipid-transfer protein n=1 Tax=Cuscuta europaea TaxID=41803 RepID=A0A9P0ZJE7_CUSEU|nr:unnamed protein product [Cuscuta europaea]
MATARSEMVKYFCVAVLCMVVLGAPHAVTAITCGQVSTNMAPCLNYLKGTGLIGTCCGGVKNLVSLATTPADRQQACTCLKTLAGSVKGLNLDTAAGLPGKCGVSIPYKISTSTDCTKVA